MRVRLFAIVGSAVVQRFAVLLMTVLAARSIGAAEFAKFAVVYATCTSLCGFIGEGLAATANKYCAAADGDGPHGALEKGAGIVSFATLVGCALAALMLIMSEPLSLVLGGGLALGPYFRLGAPIVLCLMLNAVINALLNTFSHTLAAAVASIAGAVATLSLAVGGAVLGGAYGMCAGLAIGSAVASAGFLLALKTRMPYRYFQLSAARAFLRSGKMLQFTVPTTATMALGGPVHWLCLGFLATSPAGLHSVAIFTVLFQWYSILTFVPASTVNFTLPWLARARARGASAFRRAASMAIGANLALSVALLGAMWIGQDLILSLYGPDFKGEAPILMLLGLCGVAGTLVNVMNHVSWAAGRSWSNLGSAVVYALAYVSATFWLVTLSRYGGAGLACAILLASLVQAGIQALAFLRRSAG